MPCLSTICEFAQTRHTSPVRLAVRFSFWDRSTLYFRPGEYVLSSPVTCPERQKASSRATVQSRPSVDSAHCAVAFCRTGLHISSTDRKSTRLNSSHLGISYAVF